MSRDDNVLNPRGISLYISNQLTKLTRQSDTNSIRNIKRRRSSFYHFSKNLIQKLPLRPSCIFRTKLHVITPQAPSEPNHAPRDLDDFLFTLLELILQVNITRGDERMDPRPFGVSHSLPSRLDISLVAPRETADDGDVTVLVDGVSDGFGNGLDTRNEFKTCKGRQAKLSTWKIALIAVGSFLSAFALVFFALALVFLCCKRGANKTEDAHVLDDEEEEGLSLLLNKVLAATDNLDDKYIIGRGAHGVVYKASLGPGDEYAVKKLIFAAEHVHTNQNMKREIETIGLVRHRNLVRLERFWITKENGLLLYKYMRNGSLHDVLHRGGGTRLDWSARFNVALGIAHGLAYLHHDCYPPIIHRDIKPENILMDSEMEPHIGDFGLARILDDSAISTSTITGTTGYIAPENAYRTVRGKESDVYSYGVVLLELVTGKRAVDRSLPEETDLVSWVRSVLSSYEDDTVGPVVDPTLVDELMDAKLREQAILLTDLALQCTDKRPGNRPSMRNVVKELTDVKDLVRITPGSV